LSLASVLVIWLAGCGGGTNEPTPFAGEWSGQWLDTELPNQAQTVNLSIDSSGKATGMVAIPGSMSSAVSGSVSVSGEVSMTIRDINPPPDPPVATGRFIRKSDGTVVGSLIISSNGSPISAVAVAIAKTGSSL
jgi:hypothetical protein